MTPAGIRSGTRHRPGRAAPILLKLGGELLEDAGRVQALSAAVARLTARMPLVIVHGGGREIDAALARAGIEKRQVDGLRITDEATLDVVVSVLAGLVNTRLVAALAAAGVPAVGLTGADAGLGPAEPAGRLVSTSGLSVDLGRVGEPAGTGRPRLLETLCARGYVPVLASIGAGRDGRLFNVNADTLAAHLAGRLRSPRLVVAGATAGVLDARGGTIPVLGFRDIDALVSGGGATAGMVAKLASCRHAVRSGVREVWIAGGGDVAGLEAVLRRGARGGVPGSTRVVAAAAPAHQPRGRRGVGSRHNGPPAVQVP